MKNKGFTLIEILIVFTIIVLLTLPAFMSPIKARDARRKDDIKRLNIAFEDYYGDNETYPPAAILQDCGGGQLKPYLDQPLPCDPLTHTPYCYIYDSEAPVGQEFRILASLENSSDPDIGKIGCAGTDFCGYEDECGAFGDSGFSYGFSSTNVAVLKPGTLFTSKASPSPASSAGPLPSGPLPSGPLPSASPHPGGADGYVYACDRTGICNIWDHYPDGCYFYNNVPECVTMCKTNPAYWCNK